MRFGIYTEMQSSPQRPHEQLYREILQQIEHADPADLARKLGVSRARGTQVLRLLNLAPEVLRVIAALGDPLPIVTERRLRPIVHLRKSIPLTLPQARSGETA